MEALISAGQIALWLAVVILLVIAVVCIAGGAIAIYAIVQAFRADRAEQQAKEGAQEKRPRFRKP